MDRSMMPDTQKASAEGTLACEHGRQMRKCEICELLALEGEYSRVSTENITLRAENERLREELRNMVGPVTDELLKECGKREVGNWGIINNGLCSAAAALAAKGE